MLKVAAIALLGALAVGGGWWYLVGSTSDTSLPPQQAMVAESTAVVSATPAELTIQRLGINVPIAGAVGLQVTGELEPPVSISSVVYYRHTAVPGSPGSAVILGYGTKDGVGAVFANLGKLREGDTIVITDAHGTERVFAITAIERLKNGVLPLEKIFTKDTEPTVRLLDCYEAIVESVPYCTHHVVVYASLVAVDERD